MASRKESNYVQGHVGRAASAAATKSGSGMKSIITHIFLFHDSTGRHLSQ